jgi:hypothetical protein
LQDEQNYPIITYPWRSETYSNGQNAAIWSQWDYCIMASWNTFRRLNKEPKDWCVKSDKKAISGYLPSNFYSYSLDTANEDMMNDVLKNAGNY